MGGAFSNLSGGDDGSDSKLVLKFSKSAEWNDHFNEIRDSSKLVVIDFTASWCGPCKFIKPAFHAMAEKFTDVEFVQIDVDVVPDVAKDFGVKGMPTFVMMKRGKEVARIVGAKKDELERTIEQLRT